MRTIADCYERIEKTLARTMPRSDSGWEESKHPRGKDGKFGSGGANKSAKETPASNNKSLVAKIQEIHNSGNADPWSMNADELKVWKDIATKEKNEARSHPNFKDPNSEQRNIYQHNTELLADIKMALAEKK